MNLVTKEEAMRHLRYDEEPPELDLFIAGISEALLNYLGEDAPDIQFPSYALKLACLVWMGEIDQNREGNQIAPIDSRFGYGYPPAAVVSLLAPLRCPRMA